MDRSESINELAAALAKAQADIEPAPMDSVNPHFRTRFASLASVWGTVVGPLTANGLAVVQCPEEGELGLVLRTTLMHHSGQWIGSAMPLKGHGETMQSLGSAITYARRYALAAILGIVAEEDDDAEAATAPTRAPATHRAEPPAPAHREPAAPAPRADRPGPETSWGNPPASGKQLYGWVMKREESERYRGIKKYLDKWMKMQDFPYKYGELTDEQFRAAYREVCRKLAEYDRSEELQEALAN